MRIAQSSTSFKELLYSFMISVDLLLFFSGCKVKPSAEANKEHHKEMITNSTNNTVDPKKNAGEKLSNDAVNLPFSLLESFSQEWTSGIAGGGRSTEYSFRMIINTADKIDFDSAWIGKNAFKVYLANTSKVITNRPVTIAQNDTATVRVSFSSNAKANYAPAPVNFTGAALISYRLNGKTDYFEIGSIEKKPPILGQ
ncbi:MAG: hypothetical protein NTV09_11010 [Bacteroidetes bacterium]|nr:hypothetical protein [Bacteroidota bacterium]